MSWRVIQTLCKDCKGIGTRSSAVGSNEPGATCGDCGGTGYINWGRVDIPGKTQKVESVQVQVES